VAVRPAAMRLENRAQARRSRCYSTAGRSVQAGQAFLTPAQIEEGIRDGAVLRVRPKAMTVAVIIAGLLPLFWGAGAGSEVMSRIAAPMIGGMITAPLLSMFVIPAAYRLMRIRRVARVVSREIVAR
jgi:Cu(I)/Ag(I) efflux system membrane protein CusA/SilA